MSDEFRKILSVRVKVPAIHPPLYSLHRLKGWGHALFTLVLEKRVSM